ncbi:MAG: tetratricopeptide repeat protein [Defluviicoccus sp.]
MDIILKWYAEKAPMLPQGTFENNLIFLGLLALLVVCIIWMTRRMAKGRLNLSAAREREVDLKAQLDTQAYLIRGQDVKVNDLTALLEETQAQTPATRLALCRRARSENRHEQAIAHLVSLFDDLAPVVATCSRELAEYALSLPTGADQSRQLRVASRLTRIATLCTAAGATAEQTALDAEIERRLPAAGPVPAGEVPAGKDPAGEDLTAALSALAPAYLGSADLNAAQQQLDNLVERAIALHRGGFAQTAALMLERACTIADVRFDAGDPRCAQVQATLAAAFGSLGRFPEEEAALQRLLEHEEGTLGPHHPETLRTRQSLAFVLGRQGRHDEAEALLRALVAEQEHTLGLNHPETLATQNNLAGALFRQGRLAEAEALFREVWRGRTNALGRTHTDTQRAMSNLAQTLAAAGRHDDARALWLEYLAEQERAFGADHPSTLMARLQMADGLAKAGQRTEAAAIIRGILTKLMRFLGAAHPQTVAAAEALASLAQPTDGAAEEEPTDGAAEEEPTNGAAEAEPAAVAGAGAPGPDAGGGAASRAEASLALAVAKVEANR